jgi:hypothetical protein
VVGFNPGSLAGGAFQAEAIWHMYALSINGDDSRFTQLAPTPWPGCETSVETSLDTAGRSARATPAKRNAETEGLLQHPAKEGAERIVPRPELYSLRDVAVRIPIARVN